MEEYKYAWLWTLIFGAFYFAYKGNWNWFWLSGFAAMITLGFSWIVVPFFARKIMEQHEERRRASV